jgi:hypothetical protein
MNYRCQQVKHRIWLLISTLIGLLFPEMSSTAQAPQVGVLTGKVAFRDATQIGAVAVKLIRVADETVAASTTTAADGTYTFPAVAVGGYIIAAYKDMGNSTWLEGDEGILLAGNQAAPDLTLAKKATPKINKEYYGHNRGILP